MVSNFRIMNVIEEDYKTHQLYIHCWRENYTHQEIRLSIAD